MEVKKKFQTKKSSKIFFENFSKYLHKGHIIFFYGELGVGKTYYSKLIINKLSNINFIPSPTFNIVNIYNINKFTEIWHCDLYRIKDKEEVNELGIFDNYKNKIILVEWPHLIKDYNFEVINFNIFFGKKSYERHISIKLPRSLKGIFE